MSNKPTCIIVTGRPGSGKTTLSKKLGQRLHMPVISRDEIKEGFVTTFGIGHEQLPPTTNETVSNFFFEVVCHYLANSVSIVIEAAFQHAIWERSMPRLLQLSSPYILICAVDGAIAAQRHLQRGLDDPGREFYHGDTRVSTYRATGEMPPPDAYRAPDLPVPTLVVVTETDYKPNLDEIIHRMRL